MIEKSLLGPIGLFVKFSTLQEYGVDRLFTLENRNVDTSQRNVVFLVRGEKARQVQAVAGRFFPAIVHCAHVVFTRCTPLHLLLLSRHSVRALIQMQSRGRRCDPYSTYSVLLPTVEPIALA